MASSTSNEINATATEDVTMFVPETSMNETNLNITSEAGFSLDNSLMNGTNNGATTFLGKLSDRADKLSDKAIAVTDQLTQQEKIGVALGSLAAFLGIFIFGCCCCYWKRRPGTKRSQKGDKLTQHKEPLVQVDERPWTSQWLKWEVKKGKIEFADGDVYEGELSDGKPHGWGVLRSPDAKYEGEWKDGKKHGKGVLKYADGDAYEGEWKDGKKFGKGIYKWSSTA